MDNNSIKLVKVYPQRSQSSLDLRVDINGKEYEFAIRFLETDTGATELTILKDASRWHVETVPFGHPFED